MKKFKLLVLAFVIGTMNLFATNIFPDEPLIKDIKPPVKKLLSDSTMLYINEIMSVYGQSDEINVKITFTYNSDGKLVILYMKSENDDVLLSILENLNNKRRIAAIKEYAYEMPDIQRKE